MLVSVSIEGIGGSGRRGGGDFGGGKGTRKVRWQSKMSSVDPLLGSHETRKRVPISSDTEQLSASYQPEPSIERLKYVEPIYSGKLLQEGHETAKPKMRRR